MILVPKRIGTKRLKIVSENKGLNKWICRPDCTEPTVPMKGAISPADSSIRLDRASKNSLGYFSCAGNDIQQTQKLTAVYSGVFANGHGMSITPEIFKQSMVTWAVRQTVDPSWLNWADQFQQPNIDPLPEDFITDCAVWCLFHSKNQTSALKDVEYKSTKWQVRNQFYPYSVEWLRSLESMPQEVYSQLRSAKDTYVSTWLSGRTLSTEAQALLDAGRKVYEVFYKEYANLNRTKYKLSYWDAGWYQVRNALLDAGKGLEELNALKTAHNKMRDKLRPKVYEYGFLSPEVTPPQNA